jgi:PAS domain S-box-containing protein
MSMDGLFRLVVEAAPNGMLIVDASGRIALLNTQVERMFGYARADLLGRPVETLIPDRFRGAHVGHRGGFFDAPSSRPMGVGRELYGRRQDGSEFPVEIGLTPLDTPEGRLVLSAVVDVSERKRLDALERSQQAVRRSAAESQGRSRLLATMSHEIRTPLTGIIGCIDLLEDGPGRRPSPPTAYQRDDAQGTTPAELLATVRRCADALLTIINDILDFSKLEAGGVAVAHAAYAPRDLLQDVAAIVGAHVRSKGIRLDVAVAPSVPIEVMGDAGRLRQVLLNLVHNAIKFTEHGGVDLSVTWAAAERPAAGRRRGAQGDGLAPAPVQQHHLYSPWSPHSGSSTGSTGADHGSRSSSRSSIAGLLAHDEDSAEGGSVATLPSGLSVGLGQGPAARDSSTDTRSHDHDVPLRRHDHSPAGLDGALPASGPGGPHGRLRVTVRDTGIGIAPEVQARLFRPFAQADASTTRQFGGTGLGLVISRRLVELMGGSLLVESAVGEGSAFSFDVLADLPVAATANAPSPPATTGLPIATLPQQADEAPVPVPVPPVATTVTAGDGRAYFARALLADDDAVNRTVVLAMLRRLGCEADAVVNGYEAVERLTGPGPTPPPYDLVFMDCEMPVMDGFAATIELRRRGCTVPIVAMTANALVGDREGCLRCGMDDYVSKPVRMADLRTCITHWMQVRSGTTNPTTTTASAP